MTPARWAVLRGIAAWARGGAPVKIEPMMRLWLLDAKHRLIEALDPPPAPSDKRRFRKVLRRYTPTAMGWQCLAGVPGAAP